MSSTEQLLTLQYLEQKLKQAQADVGLFSILIKEVKDLAKENKTVGTANKFLNLVKQEGPDA